VGDGLTHGGGTTATAAQRDAVAAGYVAAGHWSGARVDDGLRASARRTPGRLAVVDRDRRVTYGELDAGVDRAAALLARLGVGHGDVVSFQLPNWLEAAVLFHATARLGAISNPIVPIYRRREVGFILEQARSRVLVIPDSFRGFDHRAMVADLRPGLADLEHVLVIGEPAGDTVAFDDALAAPPHGASPPADDERRGADPVLLLYTSGTESRPKGVVHTHDTLVYECASIAELYAVTGDDVVFMPSPVTHITGLLYGLQLPFTLGAPVVLLDAWSVPAALELIERERCSFTVGATPFLHGVVHAPDLTERDISSMRVFVCGGADIPPALVRDAARRTAMLATRVYGSTECPTATGTAPREPLGLHAETDGAPIGPTEVRVVDDGGAVLTPPATGNLEVRGPDLCAGYRDPALDAAAFTADGWFRTGDLAEIDAAGRLRIAGRVKDIILRGGENLSAKEIENLLFEHPDVREVAVVAFPDPVLGERACAYVVGEADLTLESAVAFLRSRGVANQKLPERLRLVGELPKTASGKVQKFVLREAQAREAGATA
jgi:cyclohexanecarboxylate-CoA ligase